MRPRPLTRIPKSASVALWLAHSTNLRTDLSDLYVVHDSRHIGHWHTTVSGADAFRLAPAAREADSTAARYSGRAHRRLAASDRSVLVMSPYVVIVMHAVSCQLWAEVFVPSACCAAMLSGIPVADAVAVCMPHISHWIFA